MLEYILLPHTKCCLQCLNGHYVIENTFLINMLLFLLQRDWQHQQSPGAMAVCTEREIQQNVLSPGSYPTISYTGMFTCWD